ncbi:MAG: stage V sporulation protein AB [bacterium]|nr:stage V sporulation protein AB [bacterium]
MTLIERVILLFMGFAGGVGVAAGIYAFITMLQIVQRLSSRTGTANQINFYEDCVMVGGILGNLISIFEWQIHFSIVFLAIYGLFSGIFVGCLAIALAEVIDVFPAVSRRISLKLGIPFLVVAIALGKGIGTFYQLVINRA